MIILFPDTETLRLFEISNMFNMNIWNKNIGKGFPFLRAGNWWRESSQKLELVLLTACFCNKLVSIPFNMFNRIL